MMKKKKATFPTLIRPRGLQQVCFSMAFPRWRQLSGGVPPRDWHCMRVPELLKCSLTFERRQYLEDWNYCWQFRWVCSDRFFSWLHCWSFVLKYNSVPHSRSRFWFSPIPVKPPCWFSGNERWLCHVTIQVTKTREDGIPLTLWSGWKFVAL